MAKSVVIYTTNTCAYCKPIKEMLQQKQVSYEEVNLDDEPARRQELLDISGQLAVPVIVVTKDDNTRDVTVGFNPAKVAAAVS
ncbi:glutaredoxin family protein [Candidatus Microgenomates bacterium]|nr:glutaredoxin family protein [Candidatus Microgenomates bacterium]